MDSAEDRIEEFKHYETDPKDEVRILKDIIRALLPDRHAVGKLEAKLSGRDDGGWRFDCIITAQPDTSDHEAVARAVASKLGHEFKRMLTAFLIIGEQRRENEFRARIVAMLNERIADYNTRAREHSDEAERSDSPVVAGLQRSSAKTAATRRSALAIFRDDLREEMKKRERGEPDGDVLDDALSQGPAIRAIDEELERLDAEASSLGERRDSEGLDRIEAERNVLAKLRAKIIESTAPHNEDEPS